MRISDWSSDVCSSDLELARLSADYAREIARLELEIHALAGGPFTIGSPKQLGEVLFEKLGLKGGRKGKTGSHSTDVDELERLAAAGAPIDRKSTRLNSSH